MNVPSRKLRRTGKKKRRVARHNANKKKNRLDRKLKKQQRREPRLNFLKHLTKVWRMMSSTKLTLVAV